MGSQDEKSTRETNVLYSIQVEIAIIDVWRSNIFRYQTHYHVPLHLGTQAYIYIYIYIYIHIYTHSVYLSFCSFSFYREVDTKEIQSSK